MRALKCNMRDFRKRFPISSSTLLAGQCCVLNHYKTCHKFTLYFETGSILSIFLSGFFWLRLIVISSADSECEAYASAFISEIETPYWASYGFFLAHHYARVELNATDSTIDTMYSAIKYEGRSMFRFVLI